MARAHLSLLSCGLKPSGIVVFNDVCSLLTPLTVWGQGRARVELRKMVILLIKELMPRREAISLVV